MGEQKSSYLRTYVVSCVDCLLQFQLVIHTSRRTQRGRRYSATAK